MPLNYLEFLSQQVNVPNRLRHFLLLIVYCILYAVSHIYIHYIPTMGVGGREAHKNWSMVTPEKAALVGGTYLS